MDNMKYEKLEIDGVYYKTTFPEKFTSKKSWTPPEPGHVKTYIPGTVVEIHAREGQHVARGELLCILDAMKMRNRVVAP
ncbi:MAG: biotin/lipoyl-binding protein, partial [Odoribacteraceae bacterium]|nr:biotin/lipoyl-binding protein [Odoribacteraceae bacterium]